MIRLVQRKLIIPRGDTGSFSLPLISTLNSGDIAVFTIIDETTMTKVYEKIVTPEENTIVIRFEHKDTVNLPIGKYVWDIKFYTNPVYIDEELVSGQEVDSYYAAFTLPECEIRLTGDNLLVSEESGIATLSPNAINLLQHTVNDATHAAIEAAEKAQEIKDIFPQLPISENGIYTLQCQITDGAATLSWVRSDT